MKIQIINGPNLNLLGTREKGFYGDQPFESFFAELKKRFPSEELSYYQSNVEGEIINKLHEVGFRYDGIILNAGAYTHTSVALHDALKAVGLPAIEVHLSNVYKRESFRHHSYISPVADGVICGFGVQSYELALDGMSGILNTKRKA